MKKDISQGPKELKELYKVALLTRENAHCPYSGHKVGSAIQLKDGSIYSGCNVENSSYGGTACAEQVAIQKAVSEKGKIEISEIIVVTDASSPWPPCGICRQVIAEFSTNDTQIHTSNLEGALYSFSFEELIPHSFSAEHLTLID